MSGTTQPTTDHERRPLLQPEHDERAVLSTSSTVVNIQAHHEHTSSHTTGGGAGVGGEREGLTRDGPKYDRLAHHREMVRERFSANWWIEWIIIFVSYGFCGRELDENDESTCSSFMMFSFSFSFLFRREIVWHRLNVFFLAPMLMLQNTTQHISRLLLDVTSLYLSVGGLFHHRILNNAYRQTTDEGLGINRFTGFWALVVPNRLHFPHPPTLQSHAPLYLLSGLQTALFREPVDSNVGTVRPNTTS